MIESFIVLYSNHTRALQYNKLVMLLQQHVVECLVRDHVLLFLDVRFSNSSVTGGSKIYQWSYHSIQSVLGSNPHQHLTCVYMGESAGA